MIVGEKSSNMRVRDFWEDNMCVLDTSANGSCLSCGLSMKNRGWAHFWKMQEAINLEATVLANGSPTNLVGAWRHVFYWLAYASRLSDLEFLVSSGDRVCLRVLL